MSLGGIPFYLENLRKGESFAVAIERLCFSPTGILHNEYNNLFQALFNNAEVHQQIVAALATHPNGMSHAEILQKMGGKQATGSYQRAIEELIVSDFVIENTPFGKKNAVQPIDSLTNTPFSITGLSNLTKNIHKECGNN